MDDFELETRKDGSVWLWHWVKYGNTTQLDGSILMTSMTKVEQLADALNAYIKDRTNHEPDAKN